MPQSHCIIAPKMTGSVLPELIGLPLDDAVHPMLEQFHLQVTNGMPINDNIKAQFSTPIHRLIQ